MQGCLKGQLKWEQGWGAVRGQLMIIGRLKALVERKNGWMNESVSEWEQMKAARGMLQWTAVSGAVCWRGFRSELDGRDSWIRLFSIESAPRLLQSVYYSSFLLFILFAFTSSFMFIAMSCFVSISPAVHPFKRDSIPSYYPAVLISRTCNLKHLYKNIYFLDCYWQFLLLYCFSSFSITPLCASFNIWVYGTWKSDGSRVRFSCLKAYIL